MEYRPFIYALFDPAEQGHMRYVGMAPSRAYRPYDHVKRAKKGIDDSHLMRWIKKIQAEGREPSVLILEELSEGTTRNFCGFVESCYIKSLREIGHKLTNENDGGWGGSNGPHSPETRVVMRERWTPERRVAQAERSRIQSTGVVRTEASRKKQSASSRGAVRSEETKTSQSIARKAAWERGAYNTEEYHKSLSDGRKGKGVGNKNAEGTVWSSESRAQQSASQKGNQNSLGFKRSDETRARQSASAKAAWAKRIAEGYVRSPEHCANISKAKLAASAAKQETSV